MSDLSAEVKAEWAQYALMPGISDVAKTCHIHGHSYLINCFVVIQNGKPPYVAFLDEPRGACMVALENMLIAPMDTVALLPASRWRRWLIKKLAPKMVRP